MADKKVVSSNSTENTEYLLLMLLGRMKTLHGLFYDCV